MKLKCRRENAEPTDVRSVKSILVSMCSKRFFSLVHDQPSPWVSESSPKENDSELSDKIDGRMSGVSRRYVLIKRCEAAHAWVVSAL